jgi:DHA3 family tetracycline resistance protein-like MFS transporter
MPDSAKQQGQAVRIYLASSFVFAMCFALYSTVSALYRISLAGLGPLELILVGTALEASTFLFEIPTGVVADVYSRRLSVLIGYAGVGLGFAFESSYPTFAGILLAQVIWGVGHTFISGAHTAWLVDELGDRGIGPILVRRSQLARLGALVGIAGSVWLGSHSLTLPMRVGGMGLVALSLVLAFVMPERGFRPRPRAERESWRAMRETFLAGIATVKSRPALGVIVAVALFVGMSSEPLDRLWELHVLTSFSIPDWAGGDGVRVFGGLRALILALGIGVAEIVRRRTDFESTPSLVRWLVGMNLGVILAIAGFALAGDLAVAVSGYVIGTVLRGAAGPLVATWTNQQVESSERATVLSITAQADALGQTTGGPALGGIGRLFGVRAALIAATSLLVPVHLLYRRVPRPR